MNSRGSIDGVLVQWGDRWFYPGNRIVHPKGDPRLRPGSTAKRAAALRARIEATVLRKAPQVMVKVTGSERGMAAIAAHLRYISKNGRLDIEDERGQTVRGKDAVRELADEWRFGGSLIEDVSTRREAFNIMLSMPRGSADASIVQRAAREFAESELRGHKYVIVLHDHQANPHVHISVRAESNRGSRLNPRKADLHRWRETFAEKLRGYGIDAEASRQATRLVARNYDPIWRTKAKAEGRLVTHRTGMKAGSAALASRRSAAVSWRHIASALALSPQVGADRVLAVSDLVRDDATLHLAHAVTALQSRGLTRLFVEGGGVTVSRFLAQRCLDRLHLAVAPVIIGDGRRGLQLEGPARLVDCPRPRCSVYRMGSDHLWDLDLRHGNLAGRGDDVHMPDP